MTDTQSSSDTNAPWALADLATRIELYLDDAPIYGGHSDKAGGNCWELLREAMEELRTASSPTPQIAGDVSEALPDDIREQGWSVAVHNDYQLSNLRHTFWLFTKDGRAVKGEGRTDAEALNQVRAALSPQAQAGGTKSAPVDIDGIAKTIWLAEFSRAFSREPSDPWESQADSIKEGHRNTARKLVEARHIGSAGVAQAPSKQLSDFAELKLLIDEFDPANSDWNFRREVLLDVLARIWPKASSLPSTPHDTPRLCSCKASNRGGQHMARCPAAPSVEGQTCG